MSGDIRKRWANQAPLPEEIDTSSVKSTFVSFGSSVRDAAGDVTGAAGDAALGTTVYVRATDENGNSKRAVGVERANFYSYIAGDLYTGTLLDYAVANEFGKVSGFSASMGIFLKDLSAFIEDPTAFVDGIKALLKLLAEGDVDVQAIIDGYVTQFQQKQAQNNPYDPTDPDEEHLHTAFKASWYEGYAAGFVAKLVISVGVGRPPRRRSSRPTRSATSPSGSRTRALRERSRGSTAPKRRGRPARRRGFCWRSTGPFPNGC